MLKVLITGQNGQLATALNHSLSKPPYRDLIKPLFTSRLDFDITNYNQCVNYINNISISKQANKNKIDYIINCAAYTAVDMAETDRNTANLVNNIGCCNLAKLSKEFNIKLIHISTDYVFDNNLLHTPFKEDDATNPVNYYGETKLAGEHSVIQSGCEYIIIRAGWLYYYYGKNFVNTMYKLINQKDNLNIVADQIGSPTYCGDFSNFILYIISNYHPTKFNQIYNFSNSGQCSWYEFAKEIAKYTQSNCHIKPIPSSEYPTPAKRPKYSVLDKTKLTNTFDYSLVSWQDGLNKCMQHIIKQNETLTQ